MSKEAPSPLASILVLGGISANCCGIRCLVDPDGLQILAQETHSSLCRGLRIHRMSRVRRAAQLGIVVQFSALIRCLGEYFRLKYYAAGGFSLARVEPFVLGALICAVFALVGILFYFGEKYKA